MTHPILLITISCFLNTAAQIFLKMGVSRVNFSLSESLNFLLNPYIGGGICCYGLSLVFWLLALSKVDLSYGVPLLSLSYVLTALAGAYFFQESLGAWRLLGMVLIMGGIYCVSRTAG